MWTAGRYALGLLGVLLLLGLGTAGRMWRNISCYTRAAIQHSAMQIEQELPTGVHEQKLENDLATLRNELTQRQAKLNLAASEEARLQRSVTEMRSAIARRTLLLQDAAAASKKVGAAVATVSFAGREWQQEQFDLELDRLMSEQEREQGQINVLLESLKQLQESVTEGRVLAAELEKLLQGAESEWKSLQMRRDQAVSRRQLLDLVEAAGRSNSSVAAEIGRNLDRLRTEVAEVEAANTARDRLTLAKENELERADRRQALLNRLRSSPAGTGTDDLTSTTASEQERVAGQPEPAAPDVWINKL